MLLFASWLTHVSCHRCTQLQDCINVAASGHARIRCLQVAVKSCVVQVALACHVPKELAEEKGLTAKDWFETVTKAMGGEVEIKQESDELIIAICKGSKEKELFPLKMRDAGSSAGYQMLLKKGLIPENGVFPRIHFRCIWQERYPCTNTVVIFHLEQQ